MKLKQSIMQLVVYEDDYIIHLKWNKLKYRNDMHVLEYLAKIIDTQNTHILVVVGFGFDVKLVMHQFLLFNHYQ